MAQSRPAEPVASPRLRAAGTPAANAAADANTGAAANVAAATVSTERFQDWGIGCAGAANDRSCTLAQELRRREDNRRVLLLEVKPEGMDSASVGLTMPFGLDLRSGVALQIDDGAAVEGVPYRTCLQQGCLVSMRFDQGTLAALRTGKVLKVRAPVASGGVADYQVSLAGFGPAYARMVVLAATATANPPAQAR